MNEADQVHHPLRPPCDVANCPPFDASSLLSTNNQPPPPQPDRAATNAALDALLIGSLRPAPCDVHGSGPLLLSSIPASAKCGDGGRGVILGIDEAGRGPVLGPMTYAAAFWNPDGSGCIPPDLNDSKQLSPEKRASLFTQIRSSETIGFALRVLHASEISRNMLRNAPYNLNAMSHDAAMELIWAVLGAGVKIDSCYIDTVGNADIYRSKLQRVFEGRGISFVVEKKADAKYAPCSAASVVAKESRDTIIANWRWTETPNYEPRQSKQFGSGYPSDPKCKVWLESNCNIDVPFGFPDFVRFSWGPAKNALDENSEKSWPIVAWEADEDEVDGSSGKQSSLDSFVTVKNMGGTERKGRTTERKGRTIDDLRKKKPRLGIFNELGLLNVSKFIEADAF